MPKKSKRVYTAQVPDNLPDWIYKIGNTHQLCGLIFTGMGVTLEVMFPGYRRTDPYLTEHPSAELWAEILKRSDDPVYLEGGKKPWLRKAERVISGFVQQQIWVRDNHCCAYCGKMMGEVLMTIDHWVPLELGGANDTTNYISSCKSCNKDKGDMDPKEWCRKKRLDYNLYVEYVQNNGDAMTLANLIPF
jgi:hypothetical protein